MAKVTLDTNAVTVPATNSLSKFCSNLLTSFKRSLGMEEKNSSLCLVGTSVLVVGACSAAYVFLVKSRKNKK